MNGTPVKTEPRILRFGDFEADEQRFELRRRGQELPVQRRVLDTILFLARSGGRLVTDADLIAGPWQGTIVSDAAIGQAVMHARRALEDPEDPQHRYIVTVRGKGFRWNDGTRPPAERHDPPAPFAAGPVVPLSTRERSPAPARTIADADAGATLLASLQAARRHLQAARRLDDPLRQLDALLACLQDLFALGRTAELDRLARQHARLASAVGHPAHRWFATVLESARLFHQGHVTRAARLMTSNLTAGNRSLGAAAELLVAGHALNLALELVGGARQTLLKLAAKLAARAAARLPNPAPARLIMAGVALHLSDPRLARRLLRMREFRAAALPADQNLLPMLVSLSDLAIALGDRNTLHAVYRRLRAHAGMQVRRGFADWGPVLYHLVRAARGLGLGEEARRFSRRLLAEERRNSARSWKLWSAYLRAVILLGSNTAADARRALRLLEPTLVEARALRLPALTEAARGSVAQALGAARAIRSPQV